METVMRKNCILGKTFLVLLSLIFFPPFYPVSSLAYEKEISGLSSIMAAKIAKAQKKTVGVVDFTDLQGNVTELGRFLAEELSVAITGAAEGFEVVDRTHLKSILQEHKLALTGLIDPSTARKLGEITGIQALITGTITPFGDSVRLSVKVLDVATAKIIVASSGEIPKTKAIDELLARGIEQMTIIGTGEALSAPPSTPSVARGILGQAATVDVGRFLVQAESLKILADGYLMVVIAYINQTKEELEITLDYPPENKGFASDDAGNQYQLEKSSGMTRRNEDPNYDLKNPDSYINAHSTFLLCLPGKAARAAFIFRNASSRRAEVDVKKVGRYSISVAHYARPTKNFDPRNLQGAFGFSATIVNVQPN